MDGGEETILDAEERVIVRAQGRWVTRVSILLAAALTVLALLLPRLE